MHLLPNIILDIQVYSSQILVWKFKCSLFRKSIICSRSKCLTPNENSWGCIRSVSESEIAHKSVFARFEGAHCTTIWSLIWYLVNLHQACFITMYFSTLYFFKLVFPNCIFPSCHCPNCIFQTVFCCYAQVVHQMHQLTFSFPGLVFHHFSASYRSIIMWRLRNLLHFIGKVLVRKNEYLPLKFTIRNNKQCVK